MGYFNFYFLKKIFHKFLSKRMLVYIIIFLIIIILKTNVFAAYSSYDGVVDIANDLMEQQRNSQNNLVYLLMYPYYGNTPAWVNYLKPMLDDIHSNQFDFYVTYTKNSSYIEYRVAVFHTNDATALVENLQYDNVGKAWTVRANTFNSYRYIIKYYPSTNEFNVTTGTGTWTIPEAVINFKSELFIQFNNMVYGNSDQSQFFTQVLSSLNSINTVDSSILSELQTLASSLNSIETNTSTNYSQQISQISNKISDILADNDSIISQNSEMIQQQEDINNNLEQVSSDIQDVKDTLTDDTVESSASDLPSTNVSDPTATGIDNIFSSIYNAFCVGQAQDIVFPIPFTNKNITLSPYYVSDMLNNNNAGWVYTLIQAFWGYLIGRYIVSDISKKIDKIKSGNIENIENSNIKEEML